MLADIQAGRDDRNLRVDETGISGIRYPVAVADRERGKPDTIAEVSVSVDLPPGMKGAHLSRFIEVHQTAGEITPQAIPAILDVLRSRLGDTSARLELSFPFFLRRCAPVIGAAALLEYQGFLAGETAAAGTRVVVGCECRCPVSARAARRSATTEPTTSAGTSPCGCGLATLAMDR
jgi:GTP cyclohydrolase IB